MSTPSKMQVTTADVLARIAEAEAAVLAATVTLGAALMRKHTVEPARSVEPEQAAVDAARQRIEQLRALLPAVEKREQETLAETRARLAADQRRGLERALRQMTKEALSFSVHQTNAISAFRRLTRAGDAVARLLFDEQKHVGRGTLLTRLSPAGLRGVAEAELQRLGLTPQLMGELPAPGCRYDLVSFEFRNAPPHDPVD
jgi:uncharacterized protein (DUF849 family)